MERFTLDSASMGDTIQGKRTKASVFNGSRRAGRLQPEMQNDAIGDSAADHGVGGGVVRPAGEAPAVGGLPNRLLTVFEVAAFVGCHEETVRRAYWRGLLGSQRFGVRGRRFRSDDVLDWIGRGAPTTVR